MKLNAFKDVQRKINFLINAPWRVESFEFSLEVSEKISVPQITYRTDKLCVYLPACLCPCVNTPFPSISFTKIHAYNNETFLLMNPINLCTYFCNQSRFWILRSEECWRDVSVMHSISIIYTDFNDIYSVILTYFFIKL